MEIKKGISQMTEYPNVEINYVMSKDGKMNYVIKDGQLSNGCIIATLDPKHAIDEKNPCENIGVFSDNGDIIIDFNKKSIKKVTDNLVLVVNSIPITNEVLDAISKKDDQISNTVISDNEKTIIDKMMTEMGENAEMIFSDPYSEANVYATDSYNNKIGLDCSYIGKNNEGLFFHTNLVDPPSKFVKVEEFNKEEENVSLEQNNVQEEAVEDDKSIDEIEEVPSEDINEDSILKLNISDSILDGFKLDNTDLENTSVSEEETKEETEDKSLETVKINDNLEEEENNFEIENTNTNLNSGDNEILDNAIDMMNRMIEETNKLNNRIKELEDELNICNEKIRDQEKIIDNQEIKKNELNTLLTKANDVLENIK